MASGSDSGRGVAILACGGTIQNTAAGRIAAEALLAELPSSVRDHLPRIEVHDVLRVGSEDLEPKDWVTIAEAASRAVSQPHIAGIVVTHGTYTVEETAYYLHLSVSTRKPIVFACSQRKHGALGNDGDRNLVDAIRIASSAQACGKGAMLVAGEEIHCARDVRKTNQRPGGFRSGPIGILGSVESDQVTFYRSPTRRHTFDSEFGCRAAAPLPRVDIVPTYPGADGALLLAAVEAGARGIVVDGYAPQGRPYAQQRPALDEAMSRNIAVVLVSRGRQGRVPYDERIPVAASCVGGDDLSPYKARVLLMLALTTPRSASDLHRIFHEY